MNTVLSVIVTAILSAQSQPPAKQSRIPEKPIQVAATCFKTGEQTSGMNKICYYNCLGSTAAITVSAVQLCPLTIER